jgi:beta-lactamase regulating signal transducer with metallopeptidase domain
MNIVSNIAVSNFAARWDVWSQTPNVLRLSTTLLHFVWQGALAAAIGLVLLAVMRSRRPQARYVALLALFALMTAAPLVTWFSLPSDGNPSARLESVARDQQAQLVQAGETPHSTPLEFDGVLDPPSPATASAASGRLEKPWNSPVALQRPPSHFDAAVSAVGEWLRLYRPWIATAWLVGVSLLGLRLALGLADAELTRRRGCIAAPLAVEPALAELAGCLGIRRSVAVFESAMTAVPTLVGWLSPVILLPASAISGLTTEQLEAILVHELAHVRRHDYLVNLLQTVVETLLFYHPAVWWLSRKIRQERELCCDDIAIEICGDRIAYARALATLAERRVDPPSWVMAASGGVLANRIRRVVGQPQPEGTDRLSLLTVLAAMLLVFCVVGRAGDPLDAASQGPGNSPRDQAPKAEKALPDAGLMTYDFHIVTTRNKPVVGAIVKVWQVAWGQGPRSGSFDSDEKVVPPTTTDAAGVARIVLPTKGQGKMVERVRAAGNLINQIGLNIDHPQHPVWRGYAGLDGKRRIMLSDSSSVEIRAHREHESSLLERLYPALPGAPFAPIYDWSQTDGILKIRRLDLTGPTRLGLLRVVHVPDRGPALFSDLIDLKRRPEDAIALDLTLKPGVRVVGRLDRAVPRPVKNGWVIVEIERGRNRYGQAWDWNVVASISPDGSFSFESLPPDENLQLVALCDGWISSSPTRAEVEAYSLLNQEKIPYLGRRADFVAARPYRVRGKTTSIEVPMRQSASCEVTVLDEGGHPIKDAVVAFSPNQRWIYGANLLGAAYDSLELMRMQLASGVHYLADRRDVPFKRMFGARTDARGVGIVRELPAAETDDNPGTRAVPFSVTAEGYQPTNTPLERAGEGVVLVPGETAHATVRLKREPLSLKVESSSATAVVDASAKAPNDGSVTQIGGNQTSVPSTNPLTYEFHIVNTRGKPVAGAVVRPWAVSADNGSFWITEATASAAKTSSAGTAHVVFKTGGNSREAQRIQAAVKGAIHAVAIAVDHPDHPVWTGYVPVEGKRRVMLSNSTTIEVHAHREHDGTPLSRLFPVLSGSLLTGADWSERDGVLTIRRVDIDSEHPSRWLRVVQVPPAGPAFFSDLVDLRLRSENPIKLDLTVKPGVHVEGRLADSVPRLVKNGRVVAEVVAGNDVWSNWTWSATAKIAPDGRFVIESMPPEENLQLIALCDGWSSASPTLREAEIYVARYGFKDLRYRGPVSNFTCPRLFRLEGVKIEAVVPMLRTATCEVTVTDENGRPLEGASVDFWPNQLFYNVGSNIVGSGSDEMELIRQQLATKEHRADPEHLNFTTTSKYSANTDARGVALVHDLPLGGSNEPTSPVTLHFNVARRGYVTLGGPINRNYGTATLLAGKTSPVTVSLKRE